MHLGIRGKLFLSIVATFAVIILSAVITFNFSMQSSLLEKFQQNELPTVHKLQDTINDLLLQKQAEHIPFVIFEEKKYRPNMEYILLQDLQGNLLAHSFLRPVPEGLLQAHLLTPGTDYSVKYLESDWFKVFDVAVPITDGGQTAGFLRVGFDMRFVEQAIRQEIIMLLVILGIGGAVMTVIVSLLLKFFLEPLQKLQEKIEEIAQGEADLTKTLAIHSKDEIGRVSGAFNRFTGQLAGMIKRVVEASQILVQASQALSLTSDETAQAAEQISVSSQRALEDSERQQENVTAIRELVGALAAGVQETSANAQRVESIVAETVAYANAGEKAQQQALQQMQSIERSVRQATGVIKDLDAKSKEIEHILEIISGIADQTNLLALNAAIEAARAGEQGRGFAVVADEVRKLAEGSAHAVSRIANMLDEVRQGTVEAVATMEQSSAVTALGLQEVENTARLFEQIKGAIEGIAGQMNLSVEAVKEVVEASNRLVNLALEVDEAAKHNASLMQEVAAAVEQQTSSLEQVTQATEQVEAMAKDLDEMVRRFKVG